MAISWTCTSCGRPVTIGPHDYSNETRLVYTQTMWRDDRALQVTHHLYSCPNDACGRLDLSIGVEHVTDESGPNTRDRNWVAKGKAGIGTFKYLPVGGADLS